MTAGSHRLDGADGRRRTLSVDRPDPASDRLPAIDGDDDLRQDAMPPATAPGASH